MRRLQFLAEREFAKFSMMPAVFGKQVEEEYKFYERGAASGLVPAPVPLGVESPYEWPFLGFRPVEDAPDSDESLQMGGSCLGAGCGFPR